MAESEENIIKVGNDGWKELAPGRATKKKHQCWLRLHEDVMLELSGKHYVVTLVGAREFTAFQAAWVDEGIPPRSWEIAVLPMDGGSLVHLDALTVYKDLLQRKREETAKRRGGFQRRRRL